MFALFLLDPSNGLRSSELPVSSKLHSFSFRKDLFVDISDAGHYAVLYSHSSSVLEYKREYYIIYMSVDRKSIGESSLILTDSKPDNV